MEQILEIKKTTNYYEHVFQNSIQSDVKIVLPNKTIKAHKQVLGPQNPVFLDQFLSCPQLNKIEILDLNPNAVEVFIEYLYTGKISEGNITEDLLLVAHKYLDPTLKNVCRERLSKTLTILNAATRFLVFLACKENILIQETSFFLAKNYNDVKIQLDFKQILDKPEAISAVFDVFDCCKITVLTEQKNPDRKTLIDSATKSDLTIKVQNDTFLAHKDVLLTRNAVLKTVISALASESQISTTINIQELDSDIFKIFLKFIYTRDVDKENISKELMYIAHKYVDAKLKKICEGHLLPTLCEENAIEILELGTDVESKTLREEASKFIADRFEVMKEQAAYKRMKENPLAVEAIFNQFKVNIDSLFNRLEVIKNSETFHMEFSLKPPLTAEESVSSHTFFMKNCHWCIFSCVTKEEPDYLQVYLQSNEDAFFFTIKVNFSLKLISTIGKDHDVLRGPITHTFTSKDESGWKYFVGLSTLKNKEKGFIQNGNIIIQLDATFDENFSA